MWLNEGGGHHRCEVARSTPRRVLGYICIYIQREKEREREREKDKEREK